METDPLDDALEESNTKWQSEKTQQKDQRWEESVVKQLLTLGGHGAAIKELRNLVASRTGEPRLLFTTFLAHYRFPLWLHCHKIPYVFETTFEELTKKPEKSKIYRSWSKAVDDIPEEYAEKPIGLVFEWLHSGGRYKIFHTYRNWISDTSHGLRIEVPINIYGKREAFWLENLEHFLLNIGWTKPSE